MSAPVRLFSYYMTPRSRNIGQALNLTIRHISQVGHPRLGPKAWNRFLSAPVYGRILVSDKHLGPNDMPNELNYSTYYDRIMCRTFITLSRTNFRKTVFTEKATNKPDEDDNLVVKGDKVMKLNLNSTRLDGVLKAGLQISKAKIEKMFYADRIRVNGDRPKKKSQTMREGDEIDIIHKPNDVNPDFIDVSRIEIVHLGEEIEDDDEDMIEVKDTDSDEDYRIPATLKRYKRLTVENYKHKWKGPVE